MPQTEFFGRIGLGLMVASVPAKVKFTRQLELIDDFNGRRRKAQLITNNCRRVKCVD
jgi:hypothetical protein